MRSASSPTWTWCSPRRRGRWPTPTSSWCRAPAPPSPTWAGCASGGWTARSSTTRPAVGRCSASAAASRCSGPGSTTPTASRGRRVVRCRGWGCSMSPRRSGPTRCSGCPPVPRSARRPRATRSTTGGSGSTATRSSSAVPGGARCSAPCGTAAWRATASGTRCSPRSRPRRDASGVRRTSVSPSAREARLDLLGDLAEKHLDVDALLRLHGRRRVTRTAPAQASAAA